MKLSFIVSFILFFVYSCIQPPEGNIYNPEKMISIYGVLSNQKDIQYLFLSKILNKNSIKYVDDLGVTGAEVILTDQITDYSFSENDSLPGRYELINFKPVTGKEYKIKIQHQDFLTITASTIYPVVSDFEVKYIIDEDENIRLEWRHIGQTAGYKLDIYEWRKIMINWNEEVWKWILTTTQTTQNNIFMVKKEYYQYEGNWTKVKIVISAVDQNYYQYLTFDFYYDPLDFKLQAPANFSTVENGLGFFGSAYSDSLIIHK